MDLKGKTAVITGASRGIGAGLAEDFAKRGVRLALCARGELPLGDSDVVLTERFDVTDETAMNGFTERVVARFGHVDLWINNAGVLDPIAPVRDTPIEAFRHNLDVNVVGVLLGSRAYIHHIRSSRDAGVLINISSGAAQHGYAGWSAYCAGKAAVDRISECIAIEEQDSGLRVHAVAPGIYDTLMQEQIRSCTADQFPEVERFRQLKEDDAFSTVPYLARMLLELAFTPDDKADSVVIRFAPGKV